MTGPEMTAGSSSPRLAFLGTPPEAATALRGLVDAGFAVDLVVTRPDRRRGRGSNLMPSPVKQVATELGLEVTSDLADLAGRAAADPPIDIGVVVAYGRIIPAELLALLPMVNVHFSLLPRWRGAAPVERAVLAGDAETGVCLMEVAEGLDEGGVYARRTVPIDDDESVTDLRARLADLGTAMLIESLTAGLGAAEPQRGEVTYAHKIDRAETELRFDRPAVEAHRRVRVGRAWTTFRDRRLGIERSRVQPGSGAPGTLIDGRVATPDGLLELVEVKPEGKRTMPAADWLNGVQPEMGERLGSEVEPAGPAGGP